MKKIILKCLLAIIFGYLIGIILKDASERERYINHYTCATYGKADDCKTPLSIEKRLK